MFSFFFILFIALLIYWSTTVKEGFNPMNRSPSHTVTIPKIPGMLSFPDTNANANTTNATNTTKPYELPGEIPIAPYEQIASMSPLPYQDTTLVKANRQQIVSLLEMLKGFLAFEAQEISEQSDPTIQLPLSTARSDFQVLQTQVEVLNRNPGVQPNITLSHLNDITSNLSFLQDKVRLMGSAGPIQGPIYEFTKDTKEGFQNTDIATPQDLKDFVARVQGEILRLSASGTTDPVVQARVTGLTKMKSDVQGIIDQVERGDMLSVEIPIMKSDITKALPILGKPSEPLPQLLKQLRLPPGLANALPSNLQKDPETTRQISQLLDKYADTIVNGISASFMVKYTPPTRVTSSVDKTGFPSATDLYQVSNEKFMPISPDAPVTDKLAQVPSDAGRGPSHFDWKQRAKEIEAQVKKRGLKRDDFGIMPENTKVSQDFSWKGYTRMICTRLQATMDPALPETCGCPPMDWKGWRNL
jgi:hypothetical protein